MYFHENKKNTNIDKDFKENKSILLTILEFINKNKIIIIISITILVAIIMIITFTKKNNLISKVENTLVLSGDEIITLYQGNDYIEPGYEAYDSNDNILTSKVIINSNLNINEPGEYEITYTIDDITKKRTIRIIEKEDKENYTFIYLNTINNDINVYIPIGEKYQEPGYQVYTSSGKNLNELVKITGNVDTTKKGVYKLIYSIIDEKNVTITTSRNVIVMDIGINLSLNNTNKTNDKIGININVNDEYFDYLILPDGTKINTNKYTYNVNYNGSYTFTSYNKKGMSKKATINVGNIDKTEPQGSCVLDENDNGSIIKITATDESGIKKYVYNNQSYTNSKINLSNFISNATVTIYDNANNTKEINCKVTPGASITNISNNGVIVTINAKKVATEITGYYFSYDSTRPSKEGGYIATNKETIDIVRLPGTTYVWVEDKSGKVSAAKTITLTNSVLFSTTGSKYKILEGTKLSTYLEKKGWSITELNKLIARSARAAGLYTKKAAATSAVALQTVLAQKYNIRLPYWWGGKSWSTGASTEWGKYYVTYSDTTTYYYYGLDCSGFITWTYVNAGYAIPSNTYPHDYYWGDYSGMKVPINKNNGEIGDWLVNSGHIKIIIGKTSTGYITAEARGKAAGMVISTQSYSNPGSYKVVKADKFMSSKKAPKMSRNNYPSGF